MKYKLPASIAFYLSVVLCHAADQSQLVANLETGKHQTVIAYGTSLTSGGAWVEQLEQALNGDYPGTVKIINSGAGGMSSVWGVAKLDSHVIAKDPDTVFIEFAVNDAYLPYKISVEQAQSNLENMIDRILNSNRDCEIILMVMTPPISGFLKTRPKIEDYYQMYRNIAKARGLLLIDHYWNWEKILYEDPALYKKYVPDGLHPTSYGDGMVVTPQIIQSLIGAEQRDQDKADLGFEKYQMRTVATVEQSTLLCLIALIAVFCALKINKGLSYWRSVVLFWGMMVVLFLVHFIFSEAIIHVSKGIHGERNAGMLLLAIICMGWFPAIIVCTPVYHIRRLNRKAKTRSDFREHEGDKTE